jgi:hypothetical protein
MLFGGANCWAQKGAVCPSEQKLTLDDVVNAIHHLHEARCVELIEICHVSFGLDGVSLQRLANAGISDKELDMLNSETVAQLSLKQAQAEVAGLERLLANIDRSATDEQNAALAKLNADYKTQREKAANVEPKGVFETTAEYNERERQKEQNLAALDRSHEAERSRLNAKFAEDLSRRIAPMERRIRALKSAAYPLAGASLAYLNYDADKSRLMAAVNGEEYWFVIPPERARVLHDRWNAAMAIQIYSEDGSGSKYIFDTLDGQRFQGVTRAEGERSDREKAAAAETQRTLQARRSELIQRQKTEGFWIDPSTLLMWSSKDSGLSHPVYGLHWSDAQEYCSTVFLGRYSGWRLPTLAELQTIYDPSIISGTFGNGLRVHAKGGIKLSKFIILTNSKEASFDFSYGKVMQGDGFNREALCVRTTGEEAEVMRTTANTTLPTTRNGRPANAEPNQQTGVFSTDSISPHSQLQEIADALNANDLDKTTGLHFVSDGKRVYATLNWRQYSNLHDATVLANSSRQEAPDYVRIFKHLGGDVRLNVRDIHNGIANLEVGNVDELIQHPEIFNSYRDAAPMTSALYAGDFDKARALVKGMP